MSWPTLESQKAIAGVVAMLMVVSLAAGFVALAGAASNGGGIDHGNWSQFNGNFQNTGFIDTTAPTDKPIAEAWNTSLPEVSRLKASPVVVNTSHHVNRTVYLLHRDDNTLFALDAATGEERWNKSNVGNADITPAVVDLAGFENKSVVTATGIRDAVTGEHRCSLPNKATTSVTVHEGVVFYGSKEKVVAVEPSLQGLKCQKLWSQTVERGSQEINERVTRAPAVAGADGTQHITATVYVPTTGKVPPSIPFGHLLPEFMFTRGSVIALNAKTGAVRWEYIGNGTRVDSGALLCFFADVCLDKPVNGGAMHTVNSAPMVNRGKVYFGTDNGYIHAVDATTGTQEWKTLLPDGSAKAVRTSPVVYPQRQGIVYAAVDCACGHAEGDQFAALNAANGNIENSIETGTVRGPPAVAQGTIYVPTGDGQVYALNASNITDVRWIHNTGAGIEGGAAVLDGRVFVANQAANVIALEESS